MSGITSHVLDTALGRPARGLSLLLQRREASGEWRTLIQRTTNEDGRVPDLWKVLEAGEYRIIFETGAYLLATHGRSFYPQVDITFVVDGPLEHYHIPLLLSPFGYTTYRGS